jgi:hypothetical protein
MLKRVVLTGVVVGLAVLAGSPAAIAQRSTGPGRAGGQLRTTIDGKKVLPVRVRWLARPPGKAAGVAEVRFLIDGKLRWTEHAKPFNYGSDDGHGHLGWLVTSFLRAGRHRFTTEARLTSGRKLTDTVIARVAEAPAPPPALAGRWRRTLSADDLKAINPALVGVLPTGTWDRVFDRVGAWDLDPLGTGGIQHVVIHQGTMALDAPVQLGPAVNGHTNVSRFGHHDIGTWFCREDGPAGTYTWSVAGDQLTLTPSIEPCLLRQAVWAGTWTRVV